MYKCCHIVHHTLPTAWLVRSSNLADLCVIPYIPATETSYMYEILQANKGRLDFCVSKQRWNNEGVMMTTFLLSYSAF